MVTRGYSETAISLEKESKIERVRFHKDLAFIKNQIITGKFDETVKLIDKIKIKDNSVFFQAKKALTKANLLEKIHSINETGQDQLNSVFMEYCSMVEPEEKSEMKEILTCSKITDHPNYSTWNLIDGRLKTFSKIRKMLEPYYPMEEDEKCLRKGIFDNFIKNTLENTGMTMFCLN